MRYKNYTLIVAFISLLSCHQLFAAAGDNVYPVAAIPAELLKGADAVVRSEKTSFQIISTGKTVETVILAITILNKKGDRYTQKAVAYDKLTKVKSLEGALYNAEGKLVRKLKKSDIQDRSAFSDVSFVEDNRYKLASLEHKEYPFTIVWTTEVETTNTMFYPSWEPPVSEKVALEEARFEIVCPKGFSLRHRSHGLPEPQISNQQDGSKLYQWGLKNLKPVQAEPFAPYWQSSQWVITAPVEFELEGYKGNMQSWEQLGLFINQLIKGRDGLPVEVEHKIKALTAKLATPEEKTKAVYEYMQQNTRYLSISLGIGGWQPFSAAFVAEKGYGDCKALSNYTMALLKAVGIASYYTVIHADEDHTKRVIEDFPKSYFNHVILCVPQEKDTLWLECTSQTNPFGHLGSHTGNRKALLITEEGGKLVNTRHYSAKDNYRNTKTIIDLRQEQPLYKVARTYGGVQFDEPHSAMRVDPQYQKNWLYSYAGLPDVTIKQYQLKSQAGAHPSMRLEAEGVLTEKQLHSGNRLFVPLNLGKFPVDAPKPVVSRKTDFEQDWGYTYSDTIIYNVPLSYKLEHLPEPLQYKTDFGEYTLRAVHQNGQIISVSTLTLSAGLYPADRYAEWVAFIQKLRSAHATKAVLVQ